MKTQDQSCYKAVRSKYTSRTVLPAMPTRNQQSLRRSSRMSPTSAVSSTISRVVNVVPVAMSPNALFCRFATDFKHHNRCITLLIFYLLAQFRVRINVLPSSRRMPLFFAMRPVLASKSRNNNSCSSSSVLPYCDDINSLKSQFLCLLVILFSIGCCRELYNCSVRTEKTSSPSVRVRYGRYYLKYM